MDTLDNQTYNNGPGGLTPEMDREIEGTYSWMRFIAITFFVLLGLLTLVMLFALAMAPFRAEMGIALGIFLIVILLIFFPVLFLLQSGNAFRDYLVTRNIASLQTAFAKSKAHWRFIAIYLIIYVVFVILGMIFMFALGSSMLGRF